ncbi:MAG: GDSL-type esterase/lipase family protein, partial [Chloroflexota bacterium]
MNGLSDEQKFLIDFNVQDVAVALGLNISPVAGADILDVAEQDMTAYIAAIEATVADVASQLLAANDVIQAMAAALESADRVMVIGDSITTYRYSYARLLKHLLPGVEVINHGYSGYTSNHGVELTHTRFVQAQPNVVFVKYGVNDCKRFGGLHGRTLVSA